MGAPARGEGRVGGGGGGAARAVARTSVEMDTCHVRWALGGAARAAPQRPEHSSGARVPARRTGLQQPPNAAVAPGGSRPRPRAFRAWPRPPLVTAQAAGRGGGGRGGDEALRAASGKSFFASATAWARGRSAQTASGQRPVRAGGSGAIAEHKKLTQRVDRGRGGRLPCCAPPPRTAASPPAGRHAAAAVTGVSPAERPLQGARRAGRGAPPPPPASLPYKVDTSRPSLRTNWTRLVPFPQVAGSRYAEPPPPPPPLTRTHTALHGVAGLHRVGVAEGCERAPRRASPDLARAASACEAGFQAPAAAARAAARRGAPGPRREAPGAPRAATRRSSRSARGRRRARGGTAPGRDTRRVRLVRDEGRGVST